MCVSDGYSGLVDDVNSHLLDIGDDFFLMSSKVDTYLSQVPMEHTKTAN